MNACELRSDVFLTISRINEHVAHQLDQFYHKSSLEFKVDGMERTSSASALTEVSEALSSAHGKNLGLIESADTPVLSSTRASNDDDEDEATHGNPSHGDDGDGDESELKRRSFLNDAASCN